MFQRDENHAAIIRPDMLVIQTTRNVRFEMSVGAPTVSIWHSYFPVSRIFTSEGVVFFWRAAN